MPCLRRPASDQDKDMMIGKIHKTFEGRTILAVCDSDIKGKKFEQGKMQLDLSSDFYKGRKMDKEELKELFRVVDIVHLVGEKAVELGVKEGIIEKELVLEVDGVPHAEVVIVREEESKSG